MTHEQMFDKAREELERIDAHLSYVYNMLSDGEDRKHLTDVESNQRDMMWNQIAAAKSAVDRARQRQAKKVLVNGFIRVRTITKAEAELLKATLETMYSGYGISIALGPVNAEGWRFHTVDGTISVDAMDEDEQSKTTDTTQSRSRKSRR